MAEIPTIIVQIIHMEGPEKGKIQEITDHEIFIGRSSDCQVRFPSDMKVISRKHAAIRREGNQFKIVDTSSNGTIVNGKAEKEVVLKNGDVIAISQGGPKFSFLTRIGTGTTPPPPPPEQPAQHAAPVETHPVEPQQVQQPVQLQPVQPTQQHVPPQPVQPTQQPAPPQPVQPQPLQPTQQPVQPQPAATQVPQMQKVKAPLIIQYGPTLQNFDELPVTIGNQPGCQWFLDHPGILGQQILIWFDQGQYWVKDLTGRGLVTVQGIPAGEGTLLNPENQLSFSPQGPIFKFLGNGRLAEVEAPPQPSPQQQVQQPPSYSNQQSQHQNPVEHMAENISKKAKNLIGKYWKR